MLAAASATAPARRPRLRRALQLLGSLFVVWHGAALLLGTAPPSYLRAQLMPLVHGYIAALHLDGHWAFFAPDPTPGRLLRYGIEQPDGTRIEYPFSDTLPRSNASYLRYTTLAGNVDADAPALMNSIGHALCRRHAAISPRRVHFVGLQQIRITPEQVESGLHALDPSLLHRVDLGVVACDT